MYKLMCLVFLFVLIGCDNNEIKKTDEIYISGEFSGYESQQFTFEVSNSLQSDGEISVIQTNGTKAFISINNSHQFEVILPNVTEDESITLDVKVAGIINSKELKN